MLFFCMICLSVHFFCVLAVCLAALKPCSVNLVWNLFFFMTYFQFLLLQSALLLQPCLEKSTGHWPSRSRNLSYKNKMMALNGPAVIFTVFSIIKAINCIKCIHITDKTLLSVHVNRERYKLYLTISKDCCQHHLTTHSWKVL